MNESGQRVRATASALQVRPSRAPMKLRCHQRSPCQSDELSPLDALTGLAPGGQFQGPEVGTDSGITAMITEPFVIIAVKPEIGL